MARKLGANGEAMAYRMILMYIRGDLQIVEHVSEELLAGGELRMAVSFLLEVSEIWKTDRFNLRYLV